jgi:signal transduction histidine kinase
VLHDEVQQLLVAVRLRVQALRRSGAEGSQRQAVQEIDQLVEKVIQQSRSLTVELVPPVLATQGLGAALQWLADRKAEQYHQHVEVDNQLEDERDLDEPIRVFLFESVRELLFNAVKHARAQTIRIRAFEQDHQIAVSVEDDGVGFDPSDPSRYDENHTGLRRIRERVQAVGGQFAVHSKPGQGSQVLLVAPRHDRG